MKRYLKLLRGHTIGMLALIVLFIFLLAAIYAPILASNKPLVVMYDNELYFPLFRYIFYQGFYTKSIDLFFNVLMFTFPLFFLMRRKIIPVLLQLGLFVVLVLFPVKDPKGGIAFVGKLPNWTEEARGMNPYARLNLILEDKRNFEQHKRLESAIASYSGFSPTLWNMTLRDEERQIELYENDTTLFGKTKLQYIKERRAFLDREREHLTYELWPLVRDFHWEEDAGGGQSFNREVPFLEKTRTNRKDFVASLLFGIRISLVVGILSVALALVIGIPVGAISGWFGGWVDIVFLRLLEIWEGMPVFFMLLLIIAILETKSIFLVIAAVGIFGWTSIARYVRGEFFKQKGLPYVESLRAVGFPLSHILFTEILPNALPPVLTLLPFAIMGAISTEAGLSFLGLGEEGSSSWGVLMDEGRGAFPAESYLMWPPAILLTTLLVAIALFGDALRDILDPRSS